MILGALMRNSGLLVANDVNKDRVEAIISNTHRLGLTNRIMINLDGRHFYRILMVSAAGNSDLLP